MAAASASETHAVWRGFGRTVLCRAGEGEMKTFSIMTAAVEPLRLVGRRPLATIVWGLLLLAPSLLVMGAMILMLREMAASGAFTAEAMAAAEPGAGPFGDDMAAIMQFQIWSNLAQLAGILSLVVVTAAIIRGVSAGRRREGAFFLRFGMAEFQVAVVGLAVGIGFFLVALVVGLLAAGVGFALWQLIDPWRWLLCVALGLAVCLGLLLLWGRLCLLAPASLRYGTFAFEEGWKLGRGQSWRLLGLWITLLLLALALGVALLIVLAIVALVVGGGLHAADPAAIEAWAAGLPRQPALLIGGAIVLLIPVAWMQGLAQALFTAPFARVVQTLAPPDLPDAPATELH
jgi:MFS family permease